MLLLAMAPAAAEEVARVLGTAVERTELAAAPGAEADVGRLYDRIWGAVARHYVEQHGLEATSREIAELADYESEFDRRDRAQRTRKLAELERRLGEEGLSAGERARLEDFRATLARLALDDAAADREPPPEPGAEAARRAQWIERWKLARALYEEYGGVVALTPSGLFPQGARLAVIEDYERRGLLEFSDERLREQLMALLSKPPLLPLPDGQADFTPYWKRPIPPSYFPD